MAGIQILPPEEARKIAAGEVIDRPSALIREFMDNALDASASMIEVSIEGGGIVRIEVSDNGEGMSREDLELCCIAHATSKIRSLSDLENTETLGFRGEALAAAAAVSRMEILGSRDGIEAWKLETGPGKEAGLKKSRRTAGTSVRSLGLFDTIPARKRFLKREGSEASSCRNAFNDKALAFPDLGFRFFQDGVLKTFLAPNISFKERFNRTLLGGHEGKFLHEITALGTGFEVTIVFGGPELFRGDRRQQYVFANRRRIQDFSLLQALEYGTRGWFPNGTHPVGAIFVNINPALADFNIHPAKREVRFADPVSIHHAITSALENFKQQTYSGFTPGSNHDQGFEFPGENRDNRIDTAKLASEALARVDFAAEITPVYSAQSAPLALNGIRYLGRLFDLFILVEYKDRLFIIDHHAAHERILYNRLIEEPIPQQELLVAIHFSTENDEDDDFLKARQNDLAKLGIRVEKDSNRWRIDALPSDWRLSDGETVKEILNLKNAGKNMAEHWAMTLSCKKAIKDGDYVGEDTGLALAKEALNLPDPHCPHGRPIWHEISREELLRLVKRV